jgi:hypothetical protein
MLGLFDIGGKLSSVKTNKGTAFLKLTEETLE